MMDLARESGGTADIYSHLSKVGIGQVSVISGNIASVEPILREVS